MPENDMPRHNIGEGDAWAANIKRTYDEYQELALAKARAAGEHSEQLMQLGIQAVANCVQACHMLTLQAIAHRDIAVDSTWVPGPGEEGISMPEKK